MKLTKNHEKATEIYNNPCAIKESECILHISGIDNDKFASLRDIKVENAEKLTFLHQIRERRLAEPFDSIHQMGNVCSLIPEMLEGVDLDVIGYHRQCYQHFTKNQDRLKQRNNPESSMSNSQYSRKKVSTKGS